MTLEIKVWYAGDTLKIFYDFEFEEKYGAVDPISVGMVREDGKELYIVFNDFNTLSVAKHKWLMDNVMPFIGHETVLSHRNRFTAAPVMDLIITDEAAMPKSAARKKIIDFTSDIEPEFWAWYGAYDHVALCSLFGEMIDLPENWPMFTNDLKQLVAQKGNPEMPKQPENLHNALDDARFNVVRYNHLTSLPDVNPFKPIGLRPFER